MADRSQALPAYLVRWLAPAAFGMFGAFLASIVAHLGTRVRRPSVPRMSDEWLRSHGRDVDHWRESW